MKNLKSTSKTIRYVDVFFAAVECGLKKSISIKAIEKCAGVGYSTAAKVWDVMGAMEWLQTPQKSKSKVCLSDAEYEALKTRAAADTTEVCYAAIGNGEIMEEEGKKFKAVRKEFDYFADLILPALLIGVNYGSISPTVLQRRLGVDGLRAEEVYAVMDAMGYLGGADENMSSRRKVLIDAATYDKYALKYAAQKKDNK